MSLTVWRWGVVFMRVDEVTFTSPSPPEPFLHVIFRPNLKITISFAAKSGNRCEKEAFDLRILVVRYKCTQLFGLMGEKL